jgi:hypothetical protein
MCHKIFPEMKMEHTLEKKVKVKFHVKQQKSASETLQTKQ